MSNTTTCRRPISGWTLTELSLAILFALAIVGTSCSALRRLDTLQDDVHHRPPAIDAALPAPPAFRPGLPLVAILAGQAATEVTDLLGPYAVLAASAAVNVYIVAPERRPVAVWPYLELVPHYDFATFATEFPAGPDAIVIPFFSDHASQSIVAWLREHAEANVRVLSVCEGARTAAAAGLLRGRTATTHFGSRAEIARQFPDTRWLANARIVRDGPVISTAGVTAAYDGSLALLADLRGSTTAQQTAARLGLRPLSANYKSPDPRMSDKLSFAWHASGTPRRDLAIRLEPGVDEIQLAAALDVFNRSLAFRAIATAPERRIVRSRYGADLLPRESTDAFTAADPASTLNIAREWNDIASLAAYDRALERVAKSAGAQVARFVAVLIEYEYEPAAE